MVPVVPVVLLAAVPGSVVPVVPLPCRCGGDASSKSKEPRCSSTCPCVGGSGACCLLLFFVSH